MFRFLCFALVLAVAAAFAPGVAPRALNAPSAVMMAKGKANPALFKTGLEGKGKGKKVDERAVKFAEKKAKESVRAFDGSTVFPTPWKK